MVYLALLIEKRKIGTVFLVIYKIGFYTVNYLEISTAFSDSFDFGSRRRICLNYTVIGNSNSLVSPIIGLSYDVCRRGNCILCRHIGMAVKLNSFKSVIVILFGILFKSSYCLWFNDIVFLIIIKLITAVHKNKVAVFNSL